jgi:parallel beta-helix repeat protein
MDFNEIRGNQMMGVQFSESYNCTITRNWIYENGGPGVTLSGSNNMLFGNKIGWNSGPLFGDCNAYDYGLNNTWDDGVSVGNAWHDYSGTGVYSISGIAGSVDRYPSLLTDVGAPDIDSPSDLEYEEGTTGNLITWTPSHPRPDHYELYRDGSLLGSWVWNGSTIVVDVDGFSIGAYNYTVVVYNERGYESTDTVWVTVLDLTFPLLDSPSDFSYDEGTIGHSISWHPTDSNPSAYEILRDGEVIRSGAWNSSSEVITINVDGSGAGSYNYTLVVTDAGGNSVGATVIVDVVDVTSPTIDHPSDVEYEFGITGHSITWDPDDLHPASFELFRDGSLVDSGSWDGSSVTVNVDGLAVGEYNFTLVVTDIGGNSVSDTVIVTVTEAETTPTTSTTTPTSTEEIPPLDPMVIVAVIGIGAAVIVIVIIVVIRKRR